MRARLVSVNKLAKFISTALLLDKNHRIGTQFYHFIIQFYIGQKRLLKCSNLYLSFVQAHVSEEVPLEKAKNLEVNTHYNKKCLFLLRPRISQK